MVIPYQLVAMGRFRVSMLEYCKMVLEKLRFNRKLFIKEYRKSFGYLNAEEGSKFRAWARERFRKS